MTGTFIAIAIAIIFVAAAILWALSWNKEKPQVHIGGGYAIQNHGQQIIKETSVAYLNTTDDFLFGKDGKMVKGSTFYEGFMRKNSQIYLRLQIGLDGSAIFAGINDEVAKPKFQVALQYENKQCIGNPCNSQRQSVQPYMVHNGESIWVSSDVLNGIDLPEFFVLRILYRVDSGEGYKAWQIADAINVHNK